MNDPASAPQAATTWPDPARPGLPRQPEQDGHHALLMKDAAGECQVARWSAAEQEWSLPGVTLPKSPAWAARFAAYVSPVRTDAELDAAYRRGVADGRAGAAALIVEAEAAAVHAALAGRDVELQAARRAGAEEMRTRAAEVAQRNDPMLLADQLRIFRDGTEAVDSWHRRLHVAAIRALPLPDA
jgi:hypothetical protein